MSGNYVGQLHKGARKATNASGIHRLYKFAPRKEDGSLKLGHDFMALGACCKVWECVLCYWVTTRYPYVV